MPGLLRGMARTAVVAGTATAVSGRVARRQAEHFAERDQQIMASRAQGWEQGAQAGAVQQAPPPAAPTPTEEDPTVAKLKQLAELHAQGVLTDEEFSAAKAKLLGA